jgi:predicted nucleic acid-binding protein
VILVDTSVWINHLRAHDETLARLLSAAAVASHPSVIVEIALGQLRQREIVLKALQALPQVLAATEREVLRFIERRALFGRGIGYVDACLLAAVSVTPNARIWTIDRKLGAVALDLGLATSPPFPAQTLG